MGNGPHVAEHVVALGDGLDRCVTERNVIKIGAGNGIRTRDFDLGKVALYH